VQAEGVFASVSKYQGMHTVIQNPATNGEGRFVTISGSGSSGFRTQHINCFKAGDACGDFKVLANWQTIHEADNCYGGTTCSGEIKIDAASFPFVLDEGVAAGVLDAAAWFERLVVPGEGFVFATGRVQP